MFHHVLSAPSEKILSRASEKCHIYISSLTTLAGCLLVPIVTFGPGSVLTSVYTLYSPQLIFTFSLKGRRLQAQRAFTFSTKSLQRKESLKGSSEAHPKLTSANKQGLFV